MNNRILFVSVQPDEPYFHWQIEVFINNAIRLGVNPSWIHPVFSCVDSPSQELLDLMRKYNFIKFHYYRRTPIDNYGYPSMLRPDALEQHFRKYPELRGEVIFYHDADIIFKELPDFDSMYWDNFWYLSDTISYIGADYIKSKGPNLLETLCDIAGIDKDLVQSNQNNSGGAQYLMKGVTSEFWKEVSRVTLALYKFMTDEEMKERETLNEEELKNYNPIQRWCSDMWGVLWCAWKLGHQTKISDELGFSWGSSKSDEWDRYKIMHNAGVLPEEREFKFFKADYINSSPFDSDLSFVTKESNTWNYVQAILYAKMQRQLLQ